MSTDSRLTVVPSSAITDVPGLFALHPLQNVTAAVAACAQDAERDRRLSLQSVTALRDAGFLRHFVPRSRGGVEGTFSDLFHATATVAEGCASAAWCGALWAAHGRFAALLPEAAQEEIWAESADVAIAAAIAPPAGTARPAPGGWVVQGSWGYVSGVDFAQWVLLASHEATGASAPSGAVRVFAVPREQITIERTWDRTGMRGTGSHSVVLAETFVPDHRTMPLRSLLSGTTDRGRARCHRVPAHLVGGLLFAASALGAARQALRGWTSWAVQPDPSAGRCPLDGAGAREVLARSSAEIDAAGLLLTDAVQRADDSPVDDPTVARSRRDAVIATNLLVTAVERLFPNGGSHAQDVAGRLQRCRRDIQTIATHGALRLDATADALALATVGSHRPPLARVLPSAAAPWARSRPEEPVHLVFSDVDETLITCKSMLDFLEFYFTEQYGPEGARLALTTRRELATLTAAGTPREIANRAYYRVWDGESARAVETLAARWVSHRMLSGEFFVKSTYDALVRHRARGAVLVLVSGSFPALVTPVAQAIGAAHAVCTRPEERDGVLTGDIAGRPVIGEAKREAVRTVLRRYPGVDPADCFGYGDHVSDFPMLAEVGHPVAVGGDLELLRLLQAARSEEATVLTDVCCIR